jgi:CRISPR-associated endonuclease Cas2
MPKPKNKPISLKERLERMRNAGILQKSKTATHMGSDDILAPLPDRIKTILGIIKHKPQKATTMNYMIMYDIEDNKVRRLVSKYLEKEGCIRIQKSVFMANTDHPKFNTIHNTLKDINEFYENADSIILVPVNVADVRSMKLIGSNVNIDILVDPPNTIFF